ncbi:hypothetical protein Tco_1207363, partial [Tanacetum coccineum]
QLKASLGVLAVLLVSVEVIQRNPSPCFTIHTISPLKWGFGLSVLQVGRGIGSMGSGEGYGVAVKWTWESGIA